MSTFALTVHQNEHLAPGATEVNAIISVSASPGEGPLRQLQAAEIVIVDVSASMGLPIANLKAAREATAAAIECIRDGVAFAVIAGSDTAHVAYPASARLAAADKRTRADAKRAVARLQPKGGTAIGSWLALAAELFATAPSHVCHAILLTDGENACETPEQLEAVLAACEGRFQCDCRGVGTDWRVDQLRRIASRLLGTVDMIPDPGRMAREFRAMVEAAMSKATAGVSLRVWMPRGAQVVFLRQVAPAIEDLTDRATAVDALTADYPAGNWGAESRDYHLRVEVPAHDPGEEMLAARVSVVDASEPRAQGLVKVVWTDKRERSAPINHEVAHYTGQAELAECIQAGLEARKAGDYTSATLKLGRAVELANNSGNEGTLKLLAAVVEVDDAATGTVQLRQAIADTDEMMLDTRSTRTVRLSRSP